MFPRAIAIWFAILVVAFINGGFREMSLIPRLGATVGHVVSTLMLCVAVLAVTWFSIGWIGLPARSDAVRVGVLWLVLTMAFEFLGGHYLFGTPWDRVLADYNVLAGRVWVLVLVTTFSAPLLVAHMRHLLVTE